MTEGRGFSFGGWPPKWRDITDPAVLEAIKAVPRHRFVPRELWENAYEDAPLPIGHGQTISQPYIVALMTQALELMTGSRVLEVGTGSGYQSAILAHIAGRVWSVEAVPELAVQARARLAQLGYRVAVKVGDGRLGWPEQAPFDRIIVTAAGSEVPPALVRQLEPGGRLVVPVGSEVRDQVLWLIEKTPGDELQASRLADVRFVPLVASEPDEDAGDMELSRIRKRLGEIM